MRIDGIGPIGFSHMLQQSDDNVNRLLREFRAAIENGYNPNVVYDEVFEKVGCTEDDLTESDKRRLKMKVEEMCRTRRFS